MWMAILFERGKEKISMEKTQIHILGDADYIRWLI
jgi:hypothetical protein